jgi:hypothetical protein
MKIAQGFSLGSANGAGQVPQGRQSKGFCRPSPEYATVHQPPSTPRDTKEVGGEGAYSLPSQYTMVWRGAGL